MKKILLFIILFSAVSHLSAGTLTVDCKKYMSFDKNSQITLNNSFINCFENNALILKDFNFNDQYYDLMLHRTKSVVSEKTLFYRGNEKITKPKVKTFKGTINNDSRSDVLITIVDNVFFISIKNETIDAALLPKLNKENTYIFQYLKSEEFPFINPSDVVEDAELFAEIKGKLKNKLANDNKMLELELAVETDEEVFNRYKNCTNKVWPYVVALYDRVSNIYEQFLNITITLSYLNTWEGPDPYSAKGDPFVLRDKALVYWDSNYKNVTRDCYQVATSLGGGGGGFGYFNALCGNQYYGMSTVSWGGGDLEQPGFNYNIYITAHELGHNLNAQHSHSCFWDNAPLDTCIVTSENQDCLPAGQKAKPAPGSIMSYCGGINYSSGLGYYTKMVFEPQNIEIMRKYAESSDCLSEYQQKILNISEPENYTYTAGEVITINWYSNLINKVNLKYRLFDNSQWIIIAENLDAKVGSYSWQLPNICTNKYEVAVFDTDDESFFGVIDVPLTINNTTDKGLILYYPFDNDTLVDIDDYTYCGYYDIEGILQQCKDKITGKDNAILLDGSEIISANNFNSKFDKFSVSFWFNFTDGNEKRNIVGTDWQGFPFFEAYIWNNIFGFSFYMKNENVPAQIWHKYYVNPNEWYFGAFVADGKTIKLYLNGTLSETIDLKSYEIVSLLEDTKLYIGSRRDIETYSGYLDELHIYNRVLTDNEITNLYTANKINQISGFSPENKAEIKADEVKLSWNPLQNASKYMIQIIKHREGIPDEVINCKDVFQNEYTFIDTIHTDFKWRVSALINDTKTVWSDYQSFTNSSVGVKDIQNEINIECFPNPAISEMELSIDLPNQSIRNITIYNSLGKVVKQLYNGFIRDFYKEKIDIDFGSGYYCISIQTDSNTYYKTLLIVK